MILARATRIATLAASLLGPAAALAQAAASPPKTSSAPARTAYGLSGVVHSARDGSPIPHAHLRLDNVGFSSGGEPRDRGTSDNATNEFFSDAEGRFDIPVSGPGRWQINASAHGFFTQGYEQHESYESDLVLTSAVPRLDLDLRLQPDATIAGFVLDDAGEPVRGAQVSLFPAPAADTDPNEQSRGPLQIRETDDRGHYELSGLAPGAYRVSVSAQPWYAAAAGRMQRTGSTQTDPIFDVVFPLTWYPGATEADAAETIELRPGDTREADLNLLAMPAAHLRVNITRSPRDRGETGRRAQTGLPQMERISGSGADSASPMLVFDRAGQAELSGLSPGLYRVRYPGIAGSEAMFLRVTGSQRELDLAAALPSLHLSITFEGLSTEQRPLVTLTDLATGTRFDYSPTREPGDAEDAGGGARRRFGGRGGESRTLDLPAGRYRVTLSRAGSAYLTGISATGADVHGNLLDLRQTSSTLTLHVETAPSTVHGICRLRGLPLSGAMVLLVPASLGQSGSIPVVRRDQTNSDGSFDLRDVTPGQYILVAIDHGWDVNWHDPATLARYLVHGVPLSPARGRTVAQDADAQAP